MPVDLTETVLAAMQATSMRGRFDTVLDALTRAVEDSRVAIYLPDPADDTVRLVASRGVNESLLAPDYPESGLLELAASKEQDGCAGDCGQPRAAGAFGPLCSASCQLQVLSPLRDRRGLLIVGFPGAPSDSESLAHLLRSYADLITAVVRMDMLYHGFAEGEGQGTTLYGIARGLVYPDGPDRVLQQLVDVVTRVLGVRICSVMLREKSRSVLRLRAARGLPVAVVRDTEVSVGSAISGWVAETGKPLLVRDLAKEADFIGIPESRRYRTGSLLSVPLRIKGNVIGVVNVNNKDNDEVFCVADLNMLRMVTGQAAAALQDLTMLGQLSQYVMIDATTALLSESRLRQRLSEEIHRVDTFRLPAISVAFLDIIGIDRIASAAGEILSGRMLQDVAATCISGVRGLDAVAQMGAGRYAVLLLGADARGAAVAAARLRCALEGMSFPPRLMRDPLVGRLAHASYPEDGSLQADLLGIAGERARGGESFAVGTPRPAHG
ncbi:MAG: GAF domain-containing protein [Candidatus Schekmanbacteria bacterium]|nr:GAF domain-containing protein [Candidatus Schekmanbacteria bacterium]